MQQPTRLISTPFAQEGDKTEIQNVTGEFDNSATYRLGFPPLTMQSIRSGGKPPKGTDFNGVLFDITENISFLCKGGRYQYNAGLSTLIGGYPEGSNLLLDDNVTEVVSTVAGNQNNPNINMTGWVLKPNKTTAVNVADASGETQQQVNYNGGSKWHSRIGGYKLNERAVLTNGDIVKSTIDGNTNNPNSDMTGWLNIGNTGEVESIADLLTIQNPKNGNRVFVKGLQGGWFEYNASKASVNDGIMIFNGWVRITLETIIYPEWAGAVGDKVNDDTIPAQKCFDYVTDNTWKGSVYNTNRSGRAKLGVALSRQYRITDTIWIGRGTKVFGDAVICGFNLTQDTIEGACIIADFNDPLKWAISSVNYTTTGTRPTFDQIFSGTDFNESRVSHAQGIELTGFNLITATGKRVYGGVRMTCAFDAVVEVGAIGFDYGILMNASWGAKVNSLTQHYKCGLFLRSDNNNVIFNGYYNAFSSGAPIPVANGATNLITNFTSDLGIDPAYTLESANFGVVVHFGSGLSSSTCICERNTANFAVASTSVDIQTLYSESSKKTGVLNYASKLNVGDYTGYSDYSYFDIGQNGFVDVTSINKGATSQETMILHLDRYGTSLSVPKNMNGYIRGITFKGVDNILYINASTGNDLNNGLAANTAIKTLNEAFSRITQTYNLNDKNTNIQPQLKPWSIILCANGDYPVTANYQINSDVTIKTLSTSLNAVNIIYNANSLYLNSSRFRVWGANVVSARTANATYYNALFYNRSGDNVLELRGGTGHNLTNCSLIYCDETEVAAISLIIAGATVSGDATARFVQQNNVANSNHLVNVVVGKSTVSADILGRADKGVAVPVLWQGKVLGL